MKTLLILASLLTAGAYSANAQTGTTTTTRQTTTTPGTINPDQTVTPPSTTTTESSTTTTEPRVAARPRRGTVIEPADGAKVKSNGKKIKIK